MNIELMLTEQTAGPIDEMTMGSIYDSIEANLWHSEGYERQGEMGLSAECLRSAWEKYNRFADVLNVYSGNEALGSRLHRAMARRFPSEFHAAARLMEQTSLPLSA